MTCNFTRWPAAVVRCGENSEGLPINLQVAAHPWREDVALAVAPRPEHLSEGGALQSGETAWAAGEQNKMPYASLVQ